MIGSCETDLAPFCARVQRSTVLERVASYLLERIPECVGVEVVDESQLDDSEEAAEGQKREGNM